MQQLPQNEAISTEISACLATTHCTLPSAYNACNNAAIAGLVLALGTEIYVFLLVQSHLNMNPKYYPIVKSGHRVLTAYFKY